MSRPACGSHLLQGQPDFVSAAIEVSRISGVLFSSHRIVRQKRLECHALDHARMMNHDATWAKAGRELRGECRTLCGIGKHRGKRGRFLQHRRRQDWPVDGLGDDRPIAIKLRPRDRLTSCVLQAAD